MTAEHRLKPSRAGIINLWDYLDEEFVFADGRLVLRGHNGSGKTKALEVLFPFILDGSLDAKRLDPFSGQNRTMKSNLLYRGQDSEHGYVWMEFARTLDDGTAETVTLVIGLVQHKDKDRPQISFYVTDKRVGIGFGLLGADSRPLTRRQLTARLTRDARLDSKTDYQDAVDARLFGLGRERYTQLLDLLISLRRPLLAKDLDPVKVSATLSSGLSPVDEALVDQAARDFDNLKAVQDEYAKLAAADKAVGEFVEVYRTYLVRYSRQQVDLSRNRVAKAADAVDAVTQAVVSARTAKAESDKAKIALSDATGQVGTLEGRRNALKGRFDGYKDLIREAEQLAKETSRLAGDENRIGRAQKDLEDLKEESRSLEDGLRTELSTAERHGADLAAAARRAFPAIPDEEIDTGTDLPISAKALVASRTAEIREVRGLLAGIGAAATARKIAQENEETAQTGIETARTVFATAEGSIDSARAHLLNEVASWASVWSDDGDRAVMPTADVDALISAIGLIDVGDGHLLADAYRELTDPRRAAAAGAASDAARLVQDVEAAIADVWSERATVAAQRDEAPLASDLRPAGRADRKGAPLWEVVRFADHVDESAAAGIEGALYGAGLLTAWVHPDPALTALALRNQEADGYLTAVGALPEGVRTALDVLVPEEHPSVSFERISAVLSGIALTDELDANGLHSAIVTPRGSFALGVLTGSRPKVKPEFIGATNRARRREHRLSELDTRLRDLKGDLETAADRQTAAEEHVGDFARARDELPKTKALVEKLSAARTAASLLTAATEQHGRAQHRLDKAISEVGAAERELRRAATQRSLPTAAEQLDEVALAVADFGAAAGALAGSRTKAKDLEGQLAERTGRIVRKGGEIESDLEKLQDERAEHLGMLAEYEARKEAEGSGYEAVRVELDLVETRLTTARTRRADAAAAESAAQVAITEAEVTERFARNNAGAALAEMVEKLSGFAPSAHPDLRPLLGVTATALWPALPTAEELGRHLLTAVPAGTKASGGLNLLRSVLPDTCMALLDTYHAALPPGRVAEATVATAADAVWESFRELELALKTGEDGYQAEISPQAPFTVHIDSGDGRSPVATAAKKIAEDLEAQAVLLEDRERAVLEDALLTRIAHQIHGRVRRARDLVREMDADTRSKPMSSGTRIGISWVRSDKADDLQAAASSLLEHDPLGPEESVRLRTLIRGMLRNHLDRHTRDTYREALAVVLDYRTWHAFEIKLLRPGGKEERLTSKKHSEMSGGEKSAAIHLPLFAAANALYSSGRSRSPRLIALDEAFSGIDGNFTPELLGLTVKFDLDLFMTGHDLWISDAVVPMAAHYDMHHDEGTHTVSSLLLVWDGQQIVDAASGFAGNHDLEAEILGFRPNRHVRPDSVDGLAFDTGSDIDDEEDGDDEP